MMVSKDKTWFVVVSFRTELLSEYACQHGLRYFSDSTGIDFSFRYRKNVDNDICYVQEEYADFQELIKKDLLKLIPELFSVIEDKSTEFIEFSRSLAGKDLSSLSDEELGQTFHTFYNVYERLAGLIGVPALCEFALVDVLKERLKAALESKGIKFDDFLRLISFSSKETEMFKERIDLLALAEKISNEENIKPFQHDVEQHAKEYSWLTKTLFLGEDYSPDDVKEEIKSQLKHDPAKKLNDIKNKKTRQVQEFENTLAELKLPEDLQNTVRLMPELVYFRGARLEWLNQGCHNAFPLIQEIAKRLNLTFEQVIYMLPQEIEDALSSVSRPDIEEINRRIERYALVMDDGDIKLYTGDDVDKHRLNIQFKHTDELKGQSASPGKVTGKAKVVKDRTELDKVEKGDILITRLTTPDFVLAIEKSSAVVTDIGGVTSHAAIVSRELGIPCVVGTNSATQMIKDGDEVEVDADKGIVRIVKNG